MCHSVSGTIPFRRNNSHEKTGAKPSLHHIGGGGRLMSHSRPRRLKRRATRHVPNTAHGNPTTLPLPMPATCHRGVSGRHLTPLLGWTAFWWPQRSGTCPAAAQRTFPSASPHLPAKFRPLLRERAPRALTTSSTPLDAAAGVAGRSYTSRCGLLRHGEA
jgi:hypothetical protein